MNWLAIYTGGAVIFVIVGLVYLSIKDNRKADDFTVDLPDDYKGDE